MNSNRKRQLVWGTACLVLLATFLCFGKPAKDRSHRLNVNKNIVQHVAE
ncbi:MAG TPA: hypothetical protein VMZ27_06640 [Candidatus Saccharimonadales bacterium]|nr:hypothetical protein [Candidatus Saccharimonadales bacterium]